MFYANFVLAKKGPLARVWLAAHWEKKLSKAHVFETDLQSSVDSIIYPQAGKIALRTSGHLLLGVVRIYSRKAKYLLADCSEASIKIKMAFRPEVVDLPLHNQKAAVSAITLPEVHEWDALVNDLRNFDVRSSMHLNTCRVEEITMKEDLIGDNFLTEQDDFFGDTPFGKSNIDREAMRDGHSLNESMMLNDTSKLEEETTMKDFDLAMGNINSTDLQLDPMLDDGGFGAGEGLDFLEGFGKASDMDVLMDPLLEPLAPLDSLNETLTAQDGVVDTDMPILEDAVVELEPDQVVPDQTDITYIDDLVVEGVTTGGDTLLISRVEDALALEPIEESISGVRGRAGSKVKRKRKLLIDDDKMINGSTYRLQLQNTSDIIKSPLVAPPSKIRIQLYTSSMKSSFDLPISKHGKKLMKIHTENLTPRVLDEDISIPTSQEDEFELEAVSEVLRQGDETELPEKIPELEPIVVFEDADHFEPPDVAELHADLDHEILQAEKGDLLIPPPFQVNGLDVELDPLGPLDSQMDMPMAHGVDELATRNGATEKTVLEEDEEEDEDEDEEVRKYDDMKDKRWNRRAHHTIQALEIALEKKVNVRFRNIVSTKSSKKQAAYKFYTLLILNKEKAINVRQNDVFSDIFIERAERFLAV